VAKGCRQGPHATIIDDADRALLDVAGAARARPDLPEQCFDRNGSMVAW
jgi:hypothetical protein